MECQTYRDRFGPFFRTFYRFYIVRRLCTNSKREIPEEKQKNMRLLMTFRDVKYRVNLLTFIRNINENV